MQPLIRLSMGQELRVHKPDQVSNVAMFCQRVLHRAVLQYLVAIPAAVFGDCHVTGCGKVIHDSLNCPLCNAYSYCDFPHAEIGLLCD